MSGVGVRGNTVWPHDVRLGDTGSELALIGGALGAIRSLRSGGPVPVVYGPYCQHFGSVGRRRKATLWLVMLHVEGRHRPDLEHEQFQGRSLRSVVPLDGDPIVPACRN